MGISGVRVHFKEHSRELDLIITKSSYNSLLEMDWFQPLGIEVKGINRTVTSLGDYNDVCDEFPTVFNGKLGLYNGPLVTLQLDPMVRPIHIKA